jgi:hypothetical protein
MASEYPTAGETKVLNWCLEAIQEGEAFLRAQKGYGKIDETIRTIMGEHFELKETKLSGTSCNIVAKVAQNLAAGLTDTKPFWEYKTENKRYEPIAVLQGKMAVHWWLQRQIDMRMVDVAKYAEVAGTGYAHIVYDDRLDDLDMLPEDPRDILPIRPTTTLSLQDAFGVIIRRERTVNYLRSKFPTFADRIQADRDGSLSGTGDTKFGRLMDRMGLSPFQERLLGGAQRRLNRIPTTDLYTIYIDDPSKNETGAEKKMGNWDGEQELNNWSYRVKPGERLYPNKRCIVMTKSVILYDGPSIYWHGLYPICKLTLDPWPWSFLGKSPLWDILPMQVSVNEILRIFDDYLKKVARPDVIADASSVSEQLIRKIDTRKDGLKLRYKTGIGAGVQIQPPPPMPQQVMDILNWYIDKMYDLTGVNEMSQLMRMGQIPSTDTVEKIEMSLSAIVRLRSRQLEAFMREFAMMVAYNQVQFYTMKRRIVVTGVEGVTPEDFDFDPGSILPDYIHNDDFDENGNITMAAIDRGPRSRYERSREFMPQLSYSVAAGSLLNASAMQQKMMYLQLARAGLVDHFTLLEKLEIPNVGSPPPGVNSITDRLLWEQQTGMGSMSVNPAGRKASGQQSPRMVMKES